MSEIYSCSINKIWKAIALISNLQKGTRVRINPAKPTLNLIADIGEDALSLSTGFCSGHTKRGDI